MAFFKGLIAGAIGAAVGCALTHLIRDKVDGKFGDLLDGKIGELRERLSTSGGTMYDAIRQTEQSKTSGGGAYDWAVG